MVSVNFKALILELVAALRSEVSSQFNNKHKQSDHRSQQMWIICYDFWQVWPGLETVQKGSFIISYGDRDQRLQPIREVSGPDVMVRDKEN